MMNSKINNQDNQLLDEQHSPNEGASAATSTAAPSGPAVVPGEGLATPSSAIMENQRQFRKVCFDKSPAVRHHHRISTDGTSPVVSTGKRNSSSASLPHSHHVLLATSADSKRARIDPAQQAGTQSDGIMKKAPTFIRRFRLRSLPIISYNQRQFHNHAHSHNHSNNHSHNSSHNHTHGQMLAIPQHTPHVHKLRNIPPLPPINLQSLKEIDLYEILKNPQLRHDILFDPQLQFRPNLDGERGKRKKSIIDKYWMEIQKECLQFFRPQGNAVKINRLPILFTTLRDILLSLLPAKDRQKVNEIMDIDLLVQQLNHGLFDFVEMSEWLANVFKLHCAPMRDQWVVEMHQKFMDAYAHNLVEYLVAGLRLIFQILEAMKLDVANHQIRVLRPVLIETAVDFERDYFQTLILHQKINVNDLLNWLYKKFICKLNLLLEEENEDVVLNDDVLKPVVVSLIVDLLLCRQMATEFPSALAFDHTRLVLLRADVRQLVCVQLCVVLYKQLVIDARKTRPTLPVAQMLLPENVTKVQQEILAIVTDDNGNVKWTKNISAISLQLVKNITGAPLPQEMVEFSYNWLIKHIQPNSEVYGLMEGKIFKDLIGEITSILAQDTASPEGAAPPASMVPVSAITSTLRNANTKTTTPPAAASSTTELKSIASRIATLVKFHWSVFRTHYVDYIRTQHHKIQQDKLNKRKVVLGNDNCVLDTPLTATSGSRDSQGCSNAETNEKSAGARDTNKAILTT